MIKLFEAIRKAYLLIMLCVIFFNGYSHAATALRDDNNYEVGNKANKKTISEKVTVAEASSFTTELQQVVISGKVTDQKGASLTGVTVQVKGTTLGTLTDLNGKFTLSVPATSRTLSFSFVGMETKEVEIGTGNIYNVILIEKILNLDEVVVIGYGTQKKITVTGAVVSVESKELIKSPNASVTNALAGRVTGLATVQYTAKPGVDEAMMYVRGVGSLTEGASTPLMLVDGVERSFTQLDPNEIESVSLLKDASATAVYGIRGANGVIIVTTKRGIEGAPKISFTSNVGIQHPTRKVQNADSYQFALVHNGARLSDDPNAVVMFSPVAIAAFKKDRDGTATPEERLIYNDTDWPDLLLKSSAIQTQENLNIQGGSSLLKYFISLGYLSQDGLLNTLHNPNLYNYNYTRYNYRMNIDLNITKSTTFSMTTGGQSMIRLAPVGDNDSYTTYWIYYSVPYSGQLYQGNRIKVGNRYISTAEKRDGLDATGYGLGYVKGLSNVMNLDLSVGQKLDFVTKGLNWTFKVSNNTTTGQTKTRSSSQPTYDPWYLCDVDATKLGDSTIVFRKTGSAGLLGYSESSSKARNWYLETALRYDHEFGDHHLTALLLYNESKSFYAGGGYNDIPTGYVGLAARATYNYKLKYMFDLNLGYNGSENFAPGRRFGLFPAVAVGWTLTEENFVKDKIPFLDFLKLRYSYGIVGNDKGGSRFLYKPASYSASSGSYSFGTTTTVLQPGAAEGALGNPVVTWEKAYKQNLGIDLRIFKGKLGASADFFYEYRNNILTTRSTVPQIISVSLPVMNIGRVENKGYEVELKWRDNSDKVSYNISANMSYAHDKILYMDEVVQPESYLYRTGRSVGQRWAYLFDGFWLSEDIAHLSDFPDHHMTPKPGDARYKDMNGDGQISSLDMVPYGYPERPDYTFSLQGGADYKGFDFSMLWTGQTHASRVFEDLWRKAFGDTGVRGLMKYLADNQWTPETASTATLPRISFTNAMNNALASPLWYRDASYIRLKNVEIGYSFSAAILKRLRISRMRVSVSGFDLLCFDYMKGLVDPEGKVGNGQYPLVKIYNLGLNVTF